MRIVSIRRAESTTWLPLPVPPRSEDGLGDARGYCRLWFGGVLILFASRLLKEYHLLVRLLAWYVRTKKRSVIKEVCDTGKSGTVS